MSSTSAWDSYQQRRGVCRDFAHLVWRSAGHSTTRHATCAAICLILAYQLLQLPWTFMRGLKSALIMASATLAAACRGHNVHVAETEGMRGCWSPSAVAASGRYCARSPTDGPQISKAAHLAFPLRHDVRSYDLSHRHLRTITSVSMYYSIRDICHVQRHAVACRSLWRNVWRSRACAVL
jgi:hypothetical protein